MINTIPLVNKKFDNAITIGKDKSNKLQLTGVVYKFNCENCSFSHIGETKRALKKRLVEHIDKKDPKLVVSLHNNVEHNGSKKTRNKKD